MAQKITEEDFESWRANGVTERVLEHIRDGAQAVLERWADMLVVVPTAEFMQELPAHFLSMQAEYKAFTDLAEISLEDIEEPEEDDGTADGGDEPAEI